MQYQAEKTIGLFVAVGANVLVAVAIGMLVGYRSLAVPWDLSTGASGPDVVWVLVFPVMIGWLAGLYLVDHMGLGLKKCLFRFILASLLPLAMVLLLGCLLEELTYPNNRDFFLKLSVCLAAVLFCRRAWRWTTQVPESSDVSS